jgi:hypothetical protein
MVESFSRGGDERHIGMTGNSRGDTRQQVRVLCDLRVYPSSIRVIRGLKTKNSFVRFVVKIKTIY